MSLTEETELVAFIVEALEEHYLPGFGVRVIESDDPNDSPVILVDYQGAVYAIAVEQFPPREENE